MSSIRFSEFARSAPAALALVDPRGKEWSRGELFALVNRISNALRARGLSPGDALAICAPNCAEFMACYIAATQIGLYVVPINWHLAPGEVAYILQNSEAKAFVVGDRIAPLIPAILAELGAPPEVLVSVGTVRGFTPLQEFVAAASDSPPADPVPGRILAYTSATTGRPKGVSLSLADAGRALEMSIEYRLSAGVEPEKHVYLSAAMLYHAAALDGAGIALHLGHVLLLIDRWTPESLLGLIEKYGVTSAYMVPTIFGRLLALDEKVRRKYVTSTIGRVVHTGAPCSVEVKRRMMEWWGPVLYELYGAAEGAGTLVGPNDWLKYPGTVGRPLPGTRLKILDDEGVEVPAGTVGTIYMTRFTGDRFEYKGDPEKTRASYRGEFFTVGDVGYVNEDGYLFISDRKIDMIISGGMNIYSAEIEQVLGQHPKVADCAILGVPDELLGEAVTAVVQPADGVDGGRQLTSEILGFLARKLSPAKLPSRIAYTAALPRDPTGKLRKKLLRAEFFGA